MNKINMQMLPRALVVSAIMLGACVDAEPTGGAEMSSSEEVGAAPSSLTTQDILDRAYKWAHASVPYCSVPAGRYDPVCKRDCTRTGAADNPEWNLYRSDCSGFVSYAWGAPAPGKVVIELVQEHFSQRVGHWDAQPGDAFAYVSPDGPADDHIMLFVDWTSSGAARIMEELNCDHVSRDVEIPAVRNSDGSLMIYGQQYWPYRLKHVASFDQADPNAANGGQLTQTVVLTGGDYIRQRRLVGGAWQAWGAPVSTSTLRLHGEDRRIRSSSESKRPDGTTKRDLLNYDGTVIVSQSLIGGTWSNSEVWVGGMGIPGVDRLWSFDQTYGDASTGGRPRQFAVAAEGRRMHVRTHDGTRWSAWSALEIQDLGISYREVVGGVNMTVPVTQISAFSQALNPAGLPKQDVTSLTGHRVFSRTFQDGRWGDWQAFDLSNLGAL
ncbi:hypothetical protein WMF30_38100 [Sorangium sp. So ce134]